MTPIILEFYLNSHISIDTSFSFFFFFLVPAFSKESGEAFFRLSVVRDSGFVVGILSLQLLLQFKADLFETLQVL